jgi:hypothetical protein
MNRAGTIAASGARGFEYDLPQPPIYTGYDIEGLLDYYIRLEKYKNDWNDKVSLNNNIDDYETAWNDYDDAVSKFKIAPYVGYGTKVEFNNMAPGDYYFFSADPLATYGMLFEGASPFTLIGSGPVTVEIGQEYSL